MYELKENTIFFFVLFYGKNFFYNKNSYYEKESLTIYLVENKTAWIFFLHFIINFSLFFRILLLKNLSQYFTKQNDISYHEAIVEYLDFVHHYYPLYEETFSRSQAPTKVILNEECNESLH